MQKTDPADGFDDLPRHFARFIRRLAGSDDPGLYLAAALTSSHQQAGHVCIDLAEIAGTPSPTGDADRPALEEWLSLLARSPVVGSPGAETPLILDGSRLYLYRYWQYQHRLARRLRDMMARSSDLPDTAEVKNRLDQLFPGGSGNGIDWQKVAALTALQKPFCVISGGPGTG